MDTETKSISVTADVSALKHIRAFAREFFSSWAPDDAEGILLALDECCANVVRHRRDAIGEGEIRIRLEKSPLRIAIEIGQFCTPEDIDKIRPRDLEDVKPGGLGTHFVQSAFDRVLYVNDPERADAITLRLEKDIEGSETHA